MFRKGLANELRWLLVLFCAMVFVGLSFGYGREAAILALVLYVAWTLKKLHTLERWVFKARNGEISENYLHGIWGEITEDVKLLIQRQEKDKQRLQLVVERVQDMTSALHDGVVLVDARGNVEWWNRAAAQFIGLRDVDLGHRITNILRDPQFQAYFEAENFSEPLELEDFRKGNRLMMVQVHAFGQGEKVLILRDITRVAKLEQMRRDFVANVSHELRTPLTVVRGYVETLLDMPNQTPVLQRALTHIQQQGQRMTALVNDLIVLTKLETDDRSLQRDEVNVRELTGLIISDARALSDNKHSLINDVPPGLILIGNEKELRSAFSNLVFNAVKYSPEGSEIVVATDQQSEFFNLHVRDNGSGIDPIHIPRLTERFYRVDKGRSTAMGGTGLGLAIVKHVLIRHDAVLKIGSKVGRGSTFTCCFPASRLLEREHQAASSQ